MSDPIIKVEPGLDIAAAYHHPAPTMPAMTSLQVDTYDVEKSPESLRSTCLVMMKLIQHFDVVFGNRLLTQIAGELNIPLSVVEMICSEIQNGTKLPVVLAEPAALKSFQAVQKQKTDRLVQAANERNQVLRKLDDDIRKMQKTRNLVGKSLRVANKPPSGHAAQRFGQQYGTKANCAPLGKPKWVPAVKEANVGFGSTVGSSTAEPDYQRTAAVVLDRHTNPERIEYLLRVSGHEMLESSSGRLSPVEQSGMQMPLRLAANMSRFEQAGKSRADTSVNDDADGSVPLGANGSWDTCLSELDEYNLP